MAASDAGGAAVGGPRPNPSGDGPGRLQLTPGKGKPVALADITNTGRRNATKSLTVADVVKENAKLIQLLNQKTRIIDASRVEMQKLHHALHASRQQNQQLAQTNSQMLAELNLGKDRLKTLQHELSCTVALLKVKDSELEKKNKPANQRRKEVNSQATLDIGKVISSKVTGAAPHQTDGSISSTAEQRLAESRSAVPSSAGCQKPAKEITKKRGRNKRKSESSECTKDTHTIHDNYGPHLQPVISSDHEDPRKPVRRRSTRLNPGSCEVTEVSCSNLPEDDVVPSAPSFSVQKQHGPTDEKDMRKSLHNECSHELVMTSGLKIFKINEQGQKEANLKEIQEACSSVPGIETHQIGDLASNSEQSHLSETQSSLPFSIVESPKALEDMGNVGGMNKQKLKNGKDSSMENIAKCGSNISEPLRCDAKRKSQRRKSARLDSVISQNTLSTSETLHEDVIAPLLHSSSNASMEQTINQNQTDGSSSTKATEGQMAGRRSLRRAAEKVVSYKEIPLNVKMRRP